MRSPLLIANAALPSGAAASFCEQTTAAKRGRIKRAAREADYPHKITAYWLRHSLATHMLEKGASTREVQHQLTHSSLELIERYTKVTSAGLSRVMRRIA